MTIKERIDEACQDYVWQTYGQSQPENRQDFTAGAKFGIQIERERSEELVKALEGVIAVADRKTDEFDAARAAIAKWKESGE